MKGSAICVSFKKILLKIATQYAGKSNVKETGKPELSVVRVGLH
jgi:hypothetical protein